VLVDATRELTHLGGEGAGHRRRRPREHPLWELAVHHDQGLEQAVELVLVVAAVRIIRGLVLRLALLVLLVALVVLLLPACAGHLVLGGRDLVHLVGAHFLVRFLPHPPVAAELLGVRRQLLDHVAHHCDGGLEAA